MYSPIQIVSWVAVGFRLHTRLRVVREPWWDDLFVFLAALVNLVSVVAFLAGKNLHKIQSHRADSTLGIKYGLGHHLVYIINTFPTVMKHLYVTNAAYHTTTALIKLSLLLQYLRLFRQGTLRYVTMILLCAVAAWGIAFSFLAWFPCLPVSGLWDRKPDSMCYGFGYRTANETKMTLLLFASTNMFFDIVIFLIPLTEFFRPGLRKKQVMAMAGLFTMGSIVVLMAVLRLWSTFKHSSNLIKSFDFTWWYPEVRYHSFIHTPRTNVTAGPYHLLSRSRLRHHMRIDAYLLANYGCQLERNLCYEGSPCHAYESSTGFRDGPSNLTEKHC